MLLPGERCEREAERKDHRLRRFLVQFLLLNVVILAVAAAPAAGMAFILARTQAVRATAAAVQSEANVIAAPLCTPGHTALDQRHLVAGPDDRRRAPVTVIASPVRKIDRR